MTKDKIEHISKVIGLGILNSYSQIFFSNSRVLAIILLLVSFFDFEAGVSGVLAIVISQITAYLFNFHEGYIKDGTYTYNSLMVGIGLGVFYEFEPFFFLLLFISSVLTFFLTLWFANSLGKKGLPFLSIPFLITIWIVILGAENFSAFNLKEKEMFSLENWFPNLFNYVTSFIGSLPFSNALFLYFRSLGAILFQYNDLAGIVIAIGILIRSRMAFLLSLYGFAIGYFFYYFFEADFSNLIYSYIGFNFILTAIALGGFFVVASKRSFTLLLFTIPIIAILISALHTLFAFFGLPLYSLPFNIVVILFLSAMALRQKASGLHLVVNQQFSSEKNHYKFHNLNKRFGSTNYFNIGLPFLGEWRISQGYDGKITHKGEYRHALDFDITDEQDKTFTNSGTELKDYLCFDLPIIAPASGWVMKVLDGVVDNKIGDVNLEDNWGNTIIIKHAELLYSKLSHLKKNTIKVKEGDYIKKGDVVAYLGSSGRSPEPHLHFQFQATPYVGSKTLEFPLSYYISIDKDKNYEFHSYEIPKENQTVCNVQTTKILNQAFDWVPGKTLEFVSAGTNRLDKLVWEVYSDSQNRTYLYCKKTNSTAYFVNNKTVFYFTDFYGDKKSVLYLVYLGLQKILLGYYNEIEVKDELMIDSFFNPLTTALHDFTAPFFHYLKVSYTAKFVSIDQEHNPESIRIQSHCIGSVFGAEKMEMVTGLHVDTTGIHEIVIDNNGDKITLTCAN